MVLSVKAISVEKSTDTGTPNTQDILGAGFTPTAYIIETFSSDGTTDSCRGSIGFCDGTNMRCIGFGINDAVSTTVTNRIDRNDHIVYAITGGGNVNVAAEHDSFLSDGIRIRFLTNSSTGFQFRIIFFGGSDITNVKVGTFNTPTATGQFNVSTVGFDPDATWIMNTNANATVNIGGTGAKVNYGFASSSSKAFAISTLSRNGLGTSDNYKIQKMSGVVHVALAGSSQTVVSQANYTGKLGNATGFGLNFTVADNVSYPAFYLCIKGGQWDVQSVDSRTTTGNQTITTTFQPKIAITTSIVSPDENPQNDNTLSLGAASSTTSRFSIWYEDNDGESPTQSARTATASAMFHTRSATSTGSSSPITRDVDLDSFGATSCVLDYNQTTTPAVKLHVILAGDGQTITTVQKDVSFPYNIQKLVERDTAFPYHIGGGVTATPFEARYNIQGVVQKDYSFPYNINALVNKDYSFLYNIAANTNEVVKDIQFKYNIIGLIERDYEFSYHLEESHALNLSGYLKPYKCRVFIMNFDGTETYHTFNGFDFEASNIGINHLSFDLSRDTAGEFSMTVEDSNLMIDTSLVGEGCSVLIQVAKRENELGDGAHNALWGYMKVKEMNRPDTNNLIYEFTGYGAMIRTFERIIDFRDEARRLSHSTTEPDPDDTKMQAWRLFLRLFEDRSVFPAGMQRERQFDTSLIQGSDIKVDTFIPLIDQYLVEMSQAANFISDNSGAVWGVNSRKQPYLKYNTTDKTGIVIKGKIDPNDDRFKTAYFEGSMKIRDSQERGDGFFNCVFAVVGTKEITSNVINLTSIKDKWTALALDEPPSDAVDPDVVSDIGPFIPLYNADPKAAVWDDVVNYAKQYPINVFRVVVKPYSGSSGFGGLPDTAKVDWNNTIDKLQDAVNDGIYVFGWIDTDEANKSVSDVKDEIEEYATESQVNGIFLDNMSTSTSDIDYYDEIADYAKSFNQNQGQSQLPLSIYANAEGPVPQSFYTQTSIDRFIINESAGLPDPQSLMQSWYSEIGPAQRIVWCHTVTEAGYTDADVKNFIAAGAELDDLANLYYITEEDDSPGQYSHLSSRFVAMMDELDIAAAKSLQNSGQAPAGREIQQDLCMGFVAQSARTSDLIIILSKIGNPVSEPDEILNMINGTITGNRVVEVTELDEETGDVVTRQVDMPDYKQVAKIASFSIPFGEVSVESPSIHFLHKTVTKNNVVVGQRYWVFLRGRGQNSSNTFRWHHADVVGYDYKAGRRIPSAGAFSSARWDIFDRESHPGFALSYLQNTTQLAIAMNGDSARIHGQVDEVVDLSDITDDVLVSKIIQNILQEASQPKRVYTFDKVRVPDDLILPGQLVSIVDDMTSGGQVAGGTAGGIQAEVVEVSYDFDASVDPEGCSTVSIKCVTNVNREYAYWKGKIDRKELDVDFPFIPAPPPRPAPDTNSPVVIASPKGGTYNSPVSVKFITSEADCTVYYTVDGTKPLVLFGSREDELTAANTPNTTAIYRPGQSADIKINKTTELQFIATDAVLNKSTVYYEKYIINSPETAAGKALSVVFFQDTGLSEATLAASYSTYTKPDTDRVTLHKRIEEPLTTSWENQVLGTPSLMQEVEFQSVDQMSAYVAGAKAKGFDIIGFNFERDDSPDVDTRDPMAAFKKFSSIVKKYGLLVRFNPRHDYTKTYGGRVAQYCDIFNIQAHTKQGEVDEFRKFVKDMAQAVRANNCKVFVTVTLSADLQQHQSVQGQTRLQTLQNRWTYAKKYCDGVRIFFKTATEFNDIVLPFLSWMNANGRSA